MNLYEMKLGDSVWVSEFESNVLRVPGGWLFRSSDGERDIYTSSTFVPFNNEFMKTSEQGESPATDRQQLKAEIAALIPKVQAQVNYFCNEDMSFVLSKMRQLSAV